jgi:nucleoside 2-deoxyribosyltransferase
MKRIYLAGPEVFLREAIAIAEGKKRICRAHGFEGVFPLDNEVRSAGLSKRDVGVRVSRANEDLMRSCDLLIANMTPFRGPSMDAGTAFEMGFMRALGRIVLGYSNCEESFLERTRRVLGERARLRDDGQIEDEYGMFVEDRGFGDNLMLDGAVLSSGAEVIRRTAPSEALYTGLRAFEECVQEAQKFLGGAPLGTGG